MVVGNHYNLTVYGPSPIKDNGININNSSQYIQFGAHYNSCLLNPEQCAVNGFTLQFVFEYHRLEENTYLLTSGGQQPDGVGVAVIYRYGKIQIILSTLSLSWYATIGTNVLPPNQYHTVMLSWQANIGLEIFINNVLVTANPNPVPHQPSIANTSVVYFGKQPGSYTKVDFVVQSITIWYAHLQILVDFGMCKPPVRPTGKLPLCSNIYTDICKMFLYLCFTSNWPSA